MLRNSPLLIGLGVALLLATSGPVAGMLGPSAADQLANPEAASGSFFSAESAPRRILHRAGLGLALLGGALFGFGALNERAKRAAPSEPPPGASTSGRAVTGRVALTEHAAEAERRGKFSMAAELYDRLQDWPAAARCYTEAARQPGPASAQRASLKLAIQRSLASNQNDTALELLLEIGEVRQAGELKAKLGDFRGGAALLQQAGDLRSAAGVLERGGDPAGAARLLAQSGDLPAAVALLSSRPLEAAALLQEQGNLAEAARLYVEGGALESAAPLFLRAGDVKTGLDAYRKLGGLATAAEVLVEAGQPAEAGRVLVELGEFDQAEKLFRQVGDLKGFAAALEKSHQIQRAARAHFEGGDPTSALRVIAQLPTAAQESAENRVVIAASLLKLGQPAKAVATLRPLLSTEGAPRARCEWNYLLGVGYAALRDVTQAEVCFQQCLAVDRQYRDVALRLAALKSGDQVTSSTRISASAAAAPTPAAPAAPKPPAASGLPALPARYRIETKLGEGAMGVVYRARDTSLDRPVAIKLLGRELAENEQARTYFLREARAAAGLNHPNIITLYDMGVEAGQPFLVMEYLSGTDLETLTYGKKGLAVATAVHYAAQVAEALAAVHARSIVHRDVKPANLMVVEGSQIVKLMDFGVAHLSQVEGVQRRSTIVAGTPDFMAPEQMMGRGLGPWTDVFALAGTLYQFLAGAPPFEEASGGGPAVHTDPPDVRKVRRDVPPALAQLIQRCLSPDARQRPQSATEMRELLLKSAA